MLDCDLAKTLMRAFGGDGSRPRSVLLYIVTLYSYLTVNIIVTIYTVLLVGAHYYYVTGQTAPLGWFGVGLPVTRVFRD